jgi:hypothetical protein
MSETPQVVLERAASLPLFDGPRRYIREAIRAVLAERTNLAASGLAECRRANAAEAERDTLRAEAMDLRHDYAFEIERSCTYGLESGRNRLDYLNARDERDALRVEVGKLHRLLQRADALLDPEDPVQVPVWTETNEILSRCSDANERADKAEAAHAECALREADLLLQCGKAEDVVPIYNEASRLARVRAEQAEAALRETANLLQEPTQRLSQACANEKPHDHALLRTLQAALEILDGAAALRDTAPEK